MNKNAFISLPILLLLLFVMLLSYQFNQDVGVQRQWHFQESIALEGEQIWQAFEYKVMSDLVSADAAFSTCGHFCELDISQASIEAWPYMYQYQSDALLWQLEKDNNPQVVYRLCAQRQFNQSIRCWWLKEEAGRLYWFSSLHINR